MKTRQMKNKEYHKLLLRIPNTLWKAIQAQVNIEYKSYTGYIIELLRKGIKSDKKD